LQVDGYGGYTALAKRQRKITIIRPDWHDPVFGVAWEATRKLLADVENRPDAIFAFNDEAAIGVLSCARELALSVPQDIAIVGSECPTEN
jgi:LacI family transcriptional regulator